MPGGARSGAGRKRLRINLVELEKLCGLNCTDEEIAGFFGVSVRTIERRKQRPAFAEGLRTQTAIEETGNSFESATEREPNRTSRSFPGKAFAVRRARTPLATDAATGGTPGAGVAITGVGEAKT